MKLEKTFKQWNKDDLYYNFGLQRGKNNPFLKEWIERPAEITEWDKHTIAQILKTADYYIDNWNEAELREQAISPITNLVNFNGFDKNYAAFSERYLEATIKDAKLYGYVDWMVALGNAYHMNPIFCIHEYKREENSSKDVRGQLLSQMLTVQALNADEKPVYGCYVLGRLWFFAVLDGRKYDFTPGHIFTREDHLLDIVRILKGMKQMIAARADKIEQVVEDVNVS